MGLEQRWIDAKVPDEPPKRGDLVIDEDDYFGIVENVTPDGRLALFLANGTRTFADPAEVRAAMLPGNLSTCNFAELLRDG